MIDSNAEGVQPNHLNNKWKATFDKLDLRIGGPIAPAYKAHRQMFIEELPADSPRPDFNPDLSPVYTDHLAENPSKIAKLLTNVRNKDTLVVGAGGLSFLLALIQNARNIDVIDLDPNQIAWNYKIAAFISLNNSKEFQTNYSKLNSTEYDYRNFDSMRMPRIRAEYIERLPEMFEQLDIPEQYHEAIIQNFAYESLKFEHELKKTEAETGESAWDLFIERYDVIRERIINQDRWRLIENDLLDWLKENPDSYDAIYSSNVYQFVDHKIDYDDFLSFILNGLRENGVGNVYRISGTKRPYLLERKGELEVVVHEPCKAHHKRPNWLVIKKK